VHRRFRLLPVVLLAALMAARASACKSKSAAPAPAKKATIAAREWVTPLMTAPPPRPTVTMWVGVTRAPSLPE
jgi:hypothetical protein